MNDKKLLDLLYQAKEESLELPKPGESTLDAIYRLEEEIDSLEDELASLKRAKALFEALDELGLDDEAAVGEWIVAKGKEYQHGPKKDRKMAYTCFELAAMYGAVQGDVELGKTLIEGDLGITSIEEGIELLRKHSHESSEAAYLLFAYHDRFPDLIEGEEAKEAYLFAQSQGYEKAKDPLPEGYEERPYTEVLLSRYEKGDQSVCYDLAKREDLPVEKRQEFLQLALGREDPKALEEMGMIQKEEGEFEEAMTYFEKAGIKGNPYCFLFAAECLEADPHFYEGGKGPAQKEELRLYQMAAKKGVPSAMAKMAIAYFHGHGVKKDAEKAIGLARAAIKAGEFYDAPNLLGDAYLKGAGVIKSAPMAIRYYKKAAEKGNVKAMMTLSDLYMRGAPGVKKNPTLAARYRFLTGIDTD